ncbi:MAG TPA: glycosyltransferase family 39 protein, partial [Ktedonobacterales bacterium]|nr:glycosyltransferase family 39 protein [Ktedonobacterales bacterium]
MNAVGARGSAVKGESRARLLAASRYCWVARAALLFALLFAVQQISFLATAVPLRLAITSTGGMVYTDGQQLPFTLTRSPTNVVFATPPALIREFQIDGTDAANDFTEDPAYLARVADNPYIRFQAWMRDVDSYSSWHDVSQRQGSGPGRTVKSPASGDTIVPLAASGSTTIDATLLRPEVPAHIYLMCQGNICGEMVIDRNNRVFEAISYAADNSVVSDNRAYFPLQPLPFAAEVVYLLAHVLLWALTLAVVALLLAAAALPLVLVIQGWCTAYALPWSLPLRERITTSLQPLKMRLNRGIDRWDVAALALCVAALGFTCYTASAQFRAQPHILDASSYYFQARIFASGQLSAPAPTPLGAFQGPFMVAHDGRWFSQYAPLTSALLAVGIVVGVPGLVEPLLGALALWGVYRIGKRLFGARTALVALGLGVLSPFYIYLAASYLSHTVALFFAVYFVLFLLRFVAGYSAHELALAAICASCLLLTRELTAILVGFGATAFIIGSSWRQLWPAWRRLLPALVPAASILVTGVLLYLLYNKLQTGAALVTPRTLFSPSDRYGFGEGIGFYGRHTPAAGLVVLDQLLTSLLINLYGWPFYLTLALVPLAFL